MIIYLSLLIILLVAFITDSRSRIIPNKLTGISCLLGLTLSIFTDGWEGVSQALVGGAVGFGLFFLLYLCGGVGGGDVKLFAVIGIFTGTEFVFYCSLYSILYGGVIGLWILIWRNGLLNQIRTACVTFFTRVNVLRMINIHPLHTSRFPFMWAVLPGFLTTYYEFFL